MPFAFGRLALALALALVFALTAAPAFAQPSCQVTSPAPNTVRLNGTSELAGDVVLVCTGGDPAASTLYNFTLTLNVPLTTKITNTVTGETESLLLIDEPQPGLPNASNGCSPPYAGQVLGTVLLAPACAAGSGNVYQARTQSSGGVLIVNQVRWVAIPFVPPGPTGTRIIRLTNIRSSPASIGLPGSTVNALIEVDGVQPLIINQPVPGVVIASMQDGLNFTSTTPSTGFLDMKFEEKFPSAFKKRIENLSTPLDATHQDVPGTFYCTESGFTPQFSAVTPGAIGSADTGTRFLAKVSSLPPAAFLLIVPNEVTSSSGQLVAHRVFPPFAADFVGGSIPLVGGVSLVGVSGHSAEILYEVTANAPYNGVTGCSVIDAFSINVFSFFPTPLGSAVVTGHLVPTDPDPFPTPSATSPRSRFK
jgi:hypothetical protein